MVRTRNLATTFARVIALAALAGCSPSESSEAGAAAKSALPASFLLASAPAGVQPLKEVVAAAKTGDEVIAAGRVGETGRDAAFFTLVDASIKPCSEMQMDDKCPTPWDYCCEPTETMTRASATVEFRDGDHPIAGSLIGVHGLDHLKSVVVKGRAEKDPSGNLTIVASGIFVQ